jgi:molybdate transport system substrate-binding protein
MRTATLAALTLAIVVLPAGCRKAQPVELLLYCGAGLRPVADELTRVFTATHHVKIVTDYAGSEVLLSKMRLVHKGDLYMPGDRSYIEQAIQANMILSQTPVTPRISRVCTT